MALSYAQLLIKLCLKCIWNFIECLGKIYCQLSTVLRLKRTNLELSSIGNHTIFDAELQNANSINIDFVPPERYPINYI